MGYQIHFILFNFIAFQQTSQSDPCIIMVVVVGVNMC